MASKSRQLRSGFTTGACAAAAAKAAAVLLLENAERIETVEIPFPDGTRVRFPIHCAVLDASHSVPTASASVIKDAGDDPDITHGAEIFATVRFAENARAGTGIVINGGPGVGRATKPGLAIPVGAPAINPVPRRMIRDAVLEAIGRDRGYRTLLEVTISVPMGEELAKKTLNHRLGIIGGISILGTTGIVKPLSEAAWVATITASFAVAKAIGLEEVVISTGRTSEKAHQKKYALPVEAYAMMGDFTEFSLREAKKHGFRKIHLCAQWAKMIKIAMGTPQTHVRHGALEADAARDFLVGLGEDIPKEEVFNTTREIYEFIRSGSSDAASIMENVCAEAKRYGERVTRGIPVAVHLVSYGGEIIAESA